MELLIFRRQPNKSRRVTFEVKFTVSGRDLAAVENLERYWRGSGYDNATECAPEHGLRCALVQEILNLTTSPTLKRLIAWRVQRRLNPKL